MFDQEDGSSKEEIWSKIASGLVSEKIEGLIQAAFEKSSKDHDEAGALVYLDTAREVAETNGEYLELAHIYLLMCFCYSNLEDYEQVIRVSEAGADAARQGMNTSLEVDHLANAARFYRKLEKFDAMSRSFELAIELAETCAHGYLDSMRAEFGRFLRKIGDTVRARKYLEIAVASEVPAPAAKAGAELVRLLLASGDSRGALARAEEAFAGATYMNDNRLISSTQYLLARAQFACAEYSLAIASLKEIQGRSKYGVLRHKVRVELLMAEALMRTGEWDSAMPLFARIIPMLRKDKMFAELGKAYELRAECNGVMSEMSAYANDLVDSASAYSAAGDWSKFGQMTLQSATDCMSHGDWAGAYSYSRMVINQVLTAFTPEFNEALGLYAVSAARVEDLESARTALVRLSEIKDLSGITLGHKLHASSLLAEGVRARNLAAKAVKEYMLLNRGWMAQFLAENM